jgi:23S rRNA pseudouridine1911/1915/1917 synthase
LNNPQIISTDPDLVAEEATEEAADTEDTSELRDWTVPIDLHGQRLDRALAVMVPEFSRSYLRQLIEEGAVTLAGVVQGKPSQKVKAGERGQVLLRPTPQSQAFKPEAMALDVLFEDDHLLIVNKPAGLVVHPAPGNWQGTLLNGLLGRDPLAAQLPRAGIVHRLDKDTSGLMVVARTRQTMEALVRLIAAREVSRQYLAVAQGAWVGSRHKLVDAPIGRDPRNRLRMAVVDLAQACLLRCTLHTGRTHQIRVHAAHLGYPLVGDTLYGGNSQLLRQALHAQRLAFKHPATGQDLVFTAPLPPDLTALMATLGLSYTYT